MVEAGATEEFFGKVSSSGQTKLKCISKQTLMKIYHVVQEL